MTKKEKLINWAKQKWENDEEGVLIIIYNELQYVGKFDVPNIHKEVYDYIGVNLLLDDLKHYNDDLKYIDCIPPSEDDEEAYKEWYNMVTLKNVELI